MKVTVASVLVILHLAITALAQAPVQSKSGPDSAAATAPAAKAELPVGPGEPAKVEAKKDEVKKVEAKKDEAKKVEAAKEEGAKSEGAEPEAPKAGAPPTPIADKYPGDAGIEKDPRVLLAEDFESGKLDGKKWSEFSNKAGALSFSDDVSATSAGKKSLLVTAKLGENTGGHLFRRFKEGVDKMHARFYVKFAEDCDYVHHFVTLVAEATQDPWPSGGAGELPAGDRKFSSGLEPWGNWGKYPVPGAWNFYSYWWKMKRAPDGKYWGNSFAPEKPALIERGRWYCMEMMVQANTPGKADGRQAFWIDGKPVGDFGGIEWRQVGTLKINAFWLMSYITDTWAKKNRVNRVWFDDVVVATDYIGPIAARKAEGGEGAPQQKAEQGRPAEGVPKE